MKTILKINAFCSWRSKVIGKILCISLFSLSTSSWGDVIPIETITSINQINCTNTGQLCEPPYSLEIQTGGLLQINYVVPPTHCSAVKMHIFVDGSLKATTSFLGWVGAPPPFNTLPLETGLIDLGPLAPGFHLLAMQAEGEDGGCNAGQPSNWGGTLHTLATPNTVVGGSISTIAARGSVSSDTSKMSAWTGKVICQNLTTKKTKKIKMRNASSWDCEQAGLVINSGDKIRMKVNVLGYAR